MTKLLPDRPQTERAQGVSFVRDDKRNSKATSLKELPYIAVAIVGM